MLLACFLEKRNIRTLALLARSRGVLGEEL